MTRSLPVQLLNLVMTALSTLGMVTSSAASTTVTVPSGTAPGKYYVGAIADVNGAVTEGNEGNEGNNTRLATNTINVTP